MSRATVDAWYNSQRSDRIKLVAAYFALNAVVALGGAIFRVIDVVRGDSSATSYPGGQIIGAVVGLLFSAAWATAARQLWNCEKSGAYWALGLTILGVLQWAAIQPHYVGTLVFVLIPMVLIATSWRELQAKQSPAAA